VADRLLRVKQSPIDAQDHRYRFTKSFILTFENNTVSWVCKKSGSKGQVKVQLENLDSSDNSYYLSVTGENTSNDFVCISAKWVQYGVSQSHKNFLQVASLERLVGESSFSLPAYPVWVDSSSQASYFKLTAAILTSSLDLLIVDLRQIPSVVNNRTTLHHCFVSENHPDYPLLKKIRWSTIFRYLSWRDRRILNIAFYLDDSWLSLWLDTVNLRLLHHRRITSEEKEQTVGMVSVRGVSIVLTDRRCLVHSLQRLRCEKTEAFKSCSHFKWSDGHQRLILWSLNTQNVPDNPHARSLSVTMYTFKPDV